MWPRFLSRPYAGPMTELACLDGRIAPSDQTFVPATDEGLLRGDGVFEVVRVYEGAPFALAAHLLRMEGSAANLRLELPATDLLREALLGTPHGRVLEAPTSSIFWVDATGAVCTPPLDEHILASITRDRVLRVLDVDERPATLDDVQNAREVFLASTTREVQAISAIEGRQLAAAPGEVTREAAQALRAHIQEELQAVRA